MTSEAGSAQSMPFERLEVRPCTKPRHVITTDGRVLAVPSDWDLLPPGDAALSRRIKEAGPTWTVVEIRGHKRFSRGIWAPAARLAALRAARETELQDPGYAKKLESGRRRRAAEQVAYAADFEQAVRDFLHFHPRYGEVSKKIAALITAHAVPVGSGTVARTERIPIEERAEAATIAWMRHQTTGYDSMVIPRIKGKRREIRRMLAERSRELLERYRSGRSIDPATCALYRAINPNFPRGTERTAARTEGRTPPLAADLFTLGDAGQEPEWV